MSSQPFRSRFHGLAQRQGMISDALAAQSLNSFACQVIVESEIAIPPDFESATWLDTFVQRAKKDPTHFVKIDGRVRQSKFGIPTHIFEAGKKYALKIFRISNTATYTQCYNFLIKEESLLVGAFGPTLVSSCAPDIIPPNVAVLGIDSSRRLYGNSNWRVQIPYIQKALRPEGTCWALSVRDSQRVLNGDDCFLGFWKKAT